MSKIIKAKKICWLGAGLYVQREGEKNSKDDFVLKCFWHLSSLPSEQLSNVGIAFLVKMMQKEDMDNSIFLLSMPDGMENVESNILNEIDYDF